jgi:hypothetical protein
MHGYTYGEDMLLGASSLRSLLVKSMYQDLMNDHITFFFESTCGKSISTRY